MPIRFLIWRSTCTPAATIDRTNANFAKILNKPASATNFELLGLDVQLSKSSELAARLHRDHVMWKDVVRKVRFTPQS